MTIHIASDKGRPKPSDKGSLPDGKFTAEEIEQRFNALDPRGSKQERQLIARGTDPASVLGIDSAVPNDGLDYDSKGNYYEGE